MNFIERVFVLIESEVLGLPIIRNQVKTGFEEQKSYELFGGWMDFLPVWMKADVERRLKETNTCMKSNGNNDKEDRHQHLPLRYLHNQYLLCSKHLKSSQLTL